MKHHRREFLKWSDNLAIGATLAPAKTASQNGMDYYIVEQEAYPNGSPLEAVKVGAEYMKGLKYKRLSC